MAVPLDALIDSLTVEKPKCVVFPFSFPALDGADCCCCCCCCSTLGIVEVNFRFCRHSLHVHCLAAMAFVRRRRLLALVTMVDILSTSTAIEQCAANEEVVRRRLRLDEIYRVTKLTSTQRDGSRETPPESSLSPPGVALQIQGSARVLVSVSEHFRPQEKKFGGHTTLRSGCIDHGY